MIINPREFHVESDLGLMKAFLNGHQTWSKRSAYWQLGLSPLAIYLQLFDSDQYLWFDDANQPRATTQIKPQTRSWRIEIHPDWRTDDQIMTMLHHAEAQLGDGDSIQTLAYAQDRRLVSILEANGYERAENIDVYMRRSLELAIPDSDPVPGFVVRPFVDEREIVQRAGAQHDSFSGNPDPPERSIQNMRRIMDFQDGRNDVDLVAVSTDGIIAAYAYCIIDPVTLLGEFDPVGTRHAYHRRGLARAVLLEGLRRMQASGMKNAVVRTRTTNAAAIALYQAVGFAIIDNLYQYAKNDD